MTYTHPPFSVVPGAPGVHVTEMVCQLVDHVGGELVLVNQHVVLGRLVSS